MASGSVTVYTVPNAPTNPTLTGNTSSSIAFNWSAPAVGGASNYTIYRNSTLDVSSQTGTSLNDTGLSADTQYSYTVYTNYAGETSIASSPLSAWTVPNAPVSASATATGTQILLNWSPASGGQSLSYTYNLYRSVNGPAYGSTPYESGLSSSTFTDTGLIELKELTSLEQLNLYGTKVTDIGLIHLKGLPRLQWLDLRDTHVTDAGIADLMRTLPNVEIMK